MTDTTDYLAGAWAAVPGLAELEAAAGTEAAAWAEAEVALEAGTRVVLTLMVTKVFAELAAGLPALLMKCAAIAGAEAEAESAGRWGEWVGHVC